MFTFLTCFVVCLTLTVLVFFIRISLPSGSLTTSSSHTSNVNGDLSGVHPISYLLAVLLSSFLLFLLSRHSIIIVRVISYFRKSWGKTRDFSEMKHWGIEKNKGTNLRLSWLRRLSMFSSSGFGTVSISRNSALGFALASTFGFWADFGYFGQSWNFRNTRGDTTETYLPNFLDWELYLICVNFLVQETFLVDYSEKGDYGSLNVFMRQGNLNDTHLEFTIGSVTAFWNSFKDCSSTTYKSEIYVVRSRIATKTYLESKWNCLWKGHSPSIVWKCQFLLTFWNSIRILFAQRRSRVKSMENTRILTLSMHNWWTRH